MKKLIIFILILILITSFSTSTNAIIIYNEGNYIMDTQKIYNQFASLPFDCRIRVKNIIIKNTEYPLKTYYKKALNQDVDAFMCADILNGNIYIFRTSNPYISTQYIRFSLLHEIGHIIYYEFYFNCDGEKFANRFAYLMYNTNNFGKVLKQLYDEMGVN